MTAKFSTYFTRIHKTTKKKISEKHILDVEKRNVPKISFFFYLVNFPLRRSVACI